MNSITSPFKIVPFARKNPKRISIVIIPALIKIKRIIVNNSFPSATSTKGKIKEKKIKENGKVTSKKN